MHCSKDFISSMNFVKSGVCTSSKATQAERTIADTMQMLLMLNGCKTKPSQMRDRVVDLVKLEAAATNLPQHCCAQRSALLYVGPSTLKKMFVGPELVDLIGFQGQESDMAIISCF